MAKISLYNSFTRQSEVVMPIKEGKIGIYCCGPTVYNYDHIGHGRTYVFFDILVRLLKASGLGVVYVQNITDIGHLLQDAEEGEDKVEAQARQESKSPQQVIDYYTEAHWEDMNKLGNALPDHTPSASQFIPQIIEHIQTLLEKRLAYTTQEGDVYFQVEHFAEYGKLSGRSLSDMRQEYRVKHSSEKKHPADFSLWKTARGSEARVFESPWGKGIPGWHIECSVMSRHFLGQPFDIHGSAVEHLFPHHENEIAQSVGAYSTPLAHYWVHTGLLTLNGVKMSKSLGNSILIRDVLEKVDYQVLRLVLLSAHYRRPLDYQDALIQQYEVVWQNIRRRFAQADNNNRGHFAAVKDILSDDLNTPAALAYLQQHLQEIAHLELTQILNLFGIYYTKQSLPEDIQELISERDAARSRQDWQTADVLRGKLEKAGYTVEDRDGKTYIL